MSETKTKIITFRLDAALKSELAAAAEAEGKSIGEVMRDLTRQCVEQQRRQEKEDKAKCAI